MPHRLDFNCDLGEGCGDDAAIMPWISSANIACGGHAGDAASMRATLRLCRAHGVAAGAHPGYADPAHFGRRALALPPEDIVAVVREQLARLAALAAEEGVPLTHVKPHGALYNLAADDPAVADAIATAVAGFDPSLILIGLSGSQLPAAGAAAGLRVAHEVFAERGYDRHGRLLPRGTPGAVLDSLEAALAQVRELVRHGRVIAADGTAVPLRADTLCLHGDRPDAPAFARALHTALATEGIRIRPLAAPEDSSR